jgi:hypothetical protein
MVCVAGEAVDPACAGTVDGWQLTVDGWQLTVD